MKALTLKQLRYFDALARHLHFGRAAEECAVSQPALSMQIRELEDHLDVALVERTRQGVHLTEEGLEVARRAAQVLIDVQDLADGARHRKALLSGPLQLGVIPTIAPYLLPPFLPLLRQEHPDLELRLRETQTRVLLRELVEGKLDVLLLALPVDCQGVETMRLFDDPFLLAVPHSRQFKGQVRATPELLKHDRLLLLEEGHCLRDQALSFCDLRQVAHLDTFGASSLSTIVQMVANDLGVTLLPELSIDVEARSEAIRLLRFTKPEPHRVIGMAWRESSPRKRDFLELAKLIGIVHQKRSAACVPA
jgi:LysR family hydrogen peroxide-inducible transcriptional activator